MAFRHDDRVEKRRSSPQRSYVRLIRRDMAALGANGGSSDERRVRLK